MRHLIVLSGQLCLSEKTKAMVAASDFILCVDGGARHLRRLQRLPDRLIGDLDSIEPEELAWLEAGKVPSDRFPARKNQTDSQLALEWVCQRLGRPADAPPIVLAGALGSRPDHVLANQLLAASLAKEGYRLRLTDGVSDLHTLAGGQTLALTFDPDQPLPAVSTLALSESIEGLTYRGLAYPLEDYTLPFGSTRAVSNEIDAQKTDGPGPSVEITLRRGVAMVIVTPAV